MKVLLVDDEIFGFKPLFGRFNAEMLYAENESEANEILAKQSVDVILMDGNLCNGVSGADLVKRLRAIGVTTKILMFSSDEKCNGEGIAAGANGSWNKKQMGEINWKISLLNALK